MGEFQIIEGEYPRVPELLVQEAPGFAASEEYAGLHPSDHGLPTVVTGAFMRYVERLHGEASSSPATADPRIAETYRAMERLATSHDRAVANALVVDVFEHLGLQDEVLDRFVSGLGPESRALYDRWIDPMGASGTERSPRAGDDAR
jgi:hypothetical protein